MSNWGWANQSSFQAAFYPTTITSSGTSAVYPYTIYAQPQPLPSVLDGPTALSDREWLDAQVAEVCELAEAA